ncbi:unnamed protein product [Spirodela intermedia]|uniref:non-specific serine/threonine protein kinase n=1 Tax=Spirodela intermedia TaxID=51605 RepID=A0A7I8IQ25_SPIIN|nr:unnamed protein product [Spirodela intermedia]CAA6660068.1 unnamed protein product [Spirodela intermedia]
MSVLIVLFLCLVSSLRTAGASDPVAGDREALLGLKRSLEYDPLHLLSGWNLASGSHCEWYGITCDLISGRVTALNLTGALVGRLTVSIGNLTELRVLSLCGNEFYGDLPAEALARLRLMEVLELQQNNFSGVIPAQMGVLASLRILNVSYNSFSGTVPDNLIGRSTLEAVDLSHNHLAGKIPISPVDACSSLNPREISNCRNLRSLLLDGNILEGRIPAEIGRLRQLRFLDVSRNSLTDTIPPELGNCTKLSVLILTNPDDSTAPVSEFNAFVGSIPSEVLLLPSLAFLWAPRANVGGHLPKSWNNSCGLRTLNLGRNYLAGAIPEQLGMCRNLSFLDLSSNGFEGSFPVQIQDNFLAYLNISHNSLDGLLPGNRNPSRSMSRNYKDEDAGLSFEENLENLYARRFIRSALVRNPFGPISDHDPVVHDYSFNRFSGALPSFLSLSGRRLSFSLFLNNNNLSGSLSSALFAQCEDLQSFRVNLSRNLLSGFIPPSALSTCLQLTRLEAAYNQLTGPIPTIVGNYSFSHILTCEKLTLSENSFTGEIPWQLGQIVSLIILDLSNNKLTGTIPSSLGDLPNLQVLLLHHNSLSGIIPSSFSNLSRLITLDVSFNNLSGHIPHLRFISCDSYKENMFLQPCPDPDATSSSGHAQEKLNKIISSSLISYFADAPAELNYEGVVKATGNFSIKNLIGMGGFGSTYKAELVPGFLVAVKRLYIGKLQGLQQFDAEIRTLGRIRHKNLVTLMGYHMGEADTFLVYNYLSGGNLEAFIHDRSGKNACWRVVHKIALDVAQALAYLHYSCIPRIVHRDIKPSNILLDERLNAYLSDFGLAKLLEASETHATTNVAGTFGYVAPEYAITCRVSDKADVYSFGVVLLELLSGKRSLDPSFSEYGNAFNIFFSPLLWEAGPKDNLVAMLRLACLCTVESLPIRPSMKQVVEKIKKLKNY